jgi:adenylate cyclase
MAEEQTGTRNEKYWQDFLEHPDTFMTVGRHVFRRLPSSPRCQLCAAPFSGLGGSAMRMIGKKQSDGNPNMCNSCQDKLIKHHGGAEVNGAMLFADIRGSTTIAERITPTDFRALLDRFYTVASGVVNANSGIVDKFVGDELVAMFPPLFGPRYSERAINAALELLRLTGHADVAGPWVPVGAAVHTGRVWFGAVGQGHHTEITMVGDSVNTAARLAALAAAGEIVVSVDAAAEADLDVTLERRALQLKGKTEPVEVVSLHLRPD